MKIDLVSFDVEFVLDEMTVFGKEREPVVVARYKLFGLVGEVRFTKESYDEMSEEERATLIREHALHDVEEFARMGAWLAGNDSDAHARALEAVLKDMGAATEAGDG